MISIHFDTPRSGGAGDGTGDGTGGRTSGGTGGDGDFFIWSHLEKKSGISGSHTLLAKTNKWDGHLYLTLKDKTHYGNEGPVVLLQDCELKSLGILVDDTRVDVTRSDFSVSVKKNGTVVTKPNDSTKSFKAALSRAGQKSVFKKPDGKIMYDQGDVFEFIMSELWGVDVRGEASAKKFRSLITMAFFAVR